MVMRYIGMGITRNREDALKAIDTNMKHWEKFGFGFFSIFLKKTHEFVGRGGVIHLAFQDENPEVEIGYLLNQKFWGQGYATEFAKCVLDWAMKNIDVDHFVGVTYKENIASQNVLKKIGLHFDREDIYPRTNFKSLFFRINKPK
jgi:RimJ/RimL family protein N-acetyltransferase